VRRNGGGDQGLVEAEGGGSGIWNAMRSRNGWKGSRRSAGLGWHWTVGQGGLQGWNSHFLQRMEVKKVPADFLPDESSNVGLSSSELEAVSNLELFWGRDGSGSGQKCGMMEAAEGPTRQATLSPGSGALGIDLFWLSRFRVKPQQEAADAPVCKSAVVCYLRHGVAVGFVGTAHTQDRIRD